MNSFLKPLYFLAISALITNAHECEKISISIKNFDEYLRSSDFILPKLKNLQERTFVLKTIQQSNIIVMERVIMKRYIIQIIFFLW